MAFSIYDTGTVDVTAGGTVVTGDGVYWAGQNARAGDLLVIGAVSVVILDVTDSETLLIPEWPGSTETGADYYIVPQSLSRVIGRAAYEDLQRLISAMNAEGFIHFVAPDLDEPDPADGYEGQFAQKLPAGDTWQKQGDVWVYLGIYKGLAPRGAWSSVTEFSAGDIVSNLGSSYVARTTNTNKTPASNPSDWQVLAAKGETGNTGATGASYVASSATSLAVSIASKSFTTQAALAYVVGARVRMASAANTSNYMEGIVTAYSGTSMTVNVNRTNGSGTHADWSISIAGDPGSGDMLSTANLADLDDTDEALDNLGASAVGKAIFTAADADAVRTILDIDANQSLSELTSAASLALEQSEASGAALIIGSGLYDCLGNLNFIDTVRSSAVDSGTTGEIKPTMGSAATAFSYTGSENENGYTNYNHRVRIAGSLILNAGKQVRFTLRGATGGAMAVTSMWLGRRFMSGDFFDMDGNQVPIKVGGSTSFSIPQNATIVTDWVDIDVDNLSDWVLSWHSSSGSMRLKTEAGNNFYDWWTKVGSSEASLSNVSGFSFGGSYRYAGMDAMEVRGPGSLSLYSTGLTLDAIPTWAFAMVFMDAESALLNNTIVMQMSRDGTNYAYAVLSEAYTRLDGTRAYITAITDLAGIGAGNIGKWRIASYDGVKPVIKAVGIVFGE